MVPKGTNSSRREENNGVRKYGWQNFQIETLLFEERIVRSIY
jgi:hypothetical protein